MARSKQKKIKFSKGQVSERLLERTDLEVLESSASEITNFISTPYGSLQTRQGTEDMEVAFVSTTDFTVVDSMLVDATAIPSGGYGETTALGAISDDTNILSIDYGSAKDITTVDFKCYFNGVGDYTGFSATPVINSNVITDVTVVGTALKNYSSLDCVAIDPAPLHGYGATFNVVLNDSGTVTDVNVVTGGIMYSNLTYLSFFGNANSWTTTTVSVQKSDNGSTWTTVDTFDITNSDTTLKTVTINDNIRYVRFITDACKGKLYIGALSSFASSTNNVRVVPFIFNEDEKYIIIMSDGSLTIFDGTNDSTITATGLLDAYIPTVCVTQKEDIMIFTHGSMKPKQLVRTKPLGVVTWTFGDFTLENIPKYAYAGETNSSPIATNVTPSATDGLVTLTLGTARTIALGDCIDGGGGRVKITQVVSTTVYKGITIIPFYTTAVFTNWIHVTGYEDVWSATRGYPTTCLFYQQRLWFGGSLNRPNTFWFSRVDDYNNFLNVGNYDNDAGEVTIDANQSAEILAMYPNRGIQVFCAGSEWVISEGNITPNGVSIAKNTPNGIKQGIAPVDIGGVTLFIEKSGQSLLSFVYNDGQASYVTSQISMLTDLIVDPIDLDVLYHSIKNRANYLYIVLADGTMIVACILLDQQIQSFVKFETDGKIKDVCVLGDEVYLLVDRDVLTLEKFVDLQTDFTKTYLVESDATIVVGNEYEGRTVRVYNDSDEYGTFTVTGGEIEFDRTEITSTRNMLYGLNGLCWTDTETETANDMITKLDAIMGAGAVTEILKWNGSTFLSSTTDSFNIVRGDGYFINSTVNAPFSFKSIGVPVEKFELKTGDNYIGLQFGEEYTTAKSILDDINANGVIATSVAVYDNYYYNGWLSYSGSGTGTNFNVGTVYRTYTLKIIMTSDYDWYPKSSQVWGDVNVGLDFDYSVISNKIAINTQTENIEKRISKATVVTSNTDKLTFCGQTQERTGDLYDFYGVTSPSRDPRFTITGTFNPVEILSVLLNLNYGDK